jgi:hypothetical protein
MTVDWASLDDELTGLDDASREEALLRSVSLRDLAEAWCRATDRDSYDDDPEASVFGVMDWIRHEVNQRELMTLLVELAPDDDVLGVVGAGPLEDFVKAANDDRLRWVEAEAGRSPRFRYALGKVWISDDPVETFLRVERAAGVELHWPDHLGPRPSAQAT